MALPGKDPSGTEWASVVAEGSPFAIPTPPQEKGKMGETKVIVPTCVRREIQSFHRIYEMASSPVLCAIENHDLPEALSPEYRRGFYPRGWRQAQIFLPGVGVHTPLPFTN